jgi:hypothetical protein
MENRTALVSDPSLAAYGDAILGAVTRKFGPRVDMMGYHTGQRWPSTSRRDARPL